jgi:hypothetical protein
MIAALRDKFNALFTEMKYQHMMADIEKEYPNCLEFRLAETPVFIDAGTKQKLLIAGDEICSFITSTNFTAQTEQSFQHVLTPPNESALPECIVMDFAICKDNTNTIAPKLIELQGFPSLFGFEYLHDKAFRQNFEIPVGYSPYLNGYNEKLYLSHLHSIIKGVENKHTVLLELNPPTQKTRIDFYITQQLLDIPIVCLSEIFKKGSDVFYNRAGIDFKIERVYNRIVWDELGNQTELLQAKGKLLLESNSLQWVTHPNHYYRISKYLLPFLKNTAVPQTQFLSEIKSIPTDLENYVLKPLFSFAGQGVIIDITAADIAAIKNPEHWILQEKVQYAPIIETPTGPAKVEIRIFYFWNEAQNKYIATLNLARLSKGKMIGVSYNANATWVGGSLAYFEIESTIK